MRTAARHTTAARSLRADTAAGAAPDTGADTALDDALDRIAQLTARLHAVTDLHVPRRTVLRGPVCCACSRPAPCPTARASRGAA